MAERDNVSILANKTNFETERSAEEIRQDIAAKRESITETVERLNDKVQSTLDWRTYAGDYPFVALGLALGLGYAASRIFARKPSPRERIMEAIADSVEDFKDQFGGYVADLAPPNKSTISTSAKAAATALLTKAATDYVKNVLTGSRTKEPGEEGDGLSRTARASVH
jgi:hypothetical protein